MSARPPLATLAALAAAATLMLPAGGATASTPGGGPALAAARAALLRRSDLGRGWSRASAAPDRAQQLGCARDDPRTLRAHEPVAVASATWTDTSGQFVSGTSYGFPSAGSQRQAWRRLVAGSLGQCLKTNFEQGSTRGVRLRASHVKELPGPRIQRASSRLYEVAGTASGSGQDEPAFLDVLLISRGAVAIADEAASPGMPPPTGLLPKLARSQAPRLPRFR